MQKHRIYTDIGKDQKISVEIKQEYDLLEILSLKFTQEQIYTSFCGDYGVVVGRVTANNGYGVPNARVSIFVPLSDEDVDDPVISKLYPYREISDKSDDNYRYNLLPARKQHGGHTPTGTFPDQLDILTREEVLEVYEKYYKYTVKTNSSGDFMLWGVPLGPQTLHIDVDLSDIGCFSLRPDDFIRMGFGADQFETTYSFKSDSDLDSLPQIVSFRKSIEVYSFWGNDELCQIGITRADFDLSDAGVNIQPVAYIIGGTFTDSGKNTVNKNCKPRRKMGRKCGLTSQMGIIEKIRFTSDKDTLNRPILESLPTNEDVEEDGSFMFPIEMNMDYLITNEFGENDYSNDPNKGIPTSAVYRFRFSVKNETLGRIRTTASYLVPNIREYINDPIKSYAWSLNFEDYPQDSLPNILNNVDGFYYPKDYFYRFGYNKVYTVSSFQQATFKDNFFKKDDFLGIKEIAPPEEEDCGNSVNPFPVNFGIRNYTFTLLVSEVLLLVEHFLNIVKLGFFNIAVKAILKVACAIDERPTRKLSRKLKGWGFNLQERSQKHLYLIVYPECDECTGENELANYPPYSNDNDLIPCTVGSLHLDNPTRGMGVNVDLTGFTFSPSTAGNCAACTNPYLDIMTQYQSNPYYYSGYTPLAYFGDNQNQYCLYEGGEIIPIDGHIGGTPVYWKSYTYDFSAYVGVTSLDLVYDGVSYTIPLPLSSSTFFSNFPPNVFGPGGATLTIISGDQFTIAPNCTKVFGGLTVTYSTGTAVVPPSVFTSNIIIDYTNVYFFDEDSDFADPPPPYPATPTGFTVDIVLCPDSGCSENVPSPPITVKLESGCEIYDTPYNEDLANRYVITSGFTNIVPDTDINGFAEYGTWQDESGRQYSQTAQACGNIFSTVLSDITAWYVCEASKRGGDDFVYFNDWSVPLPKNWDGTHRIKITRSGVSEFSNGVFYMVPGSQTFGRLLEILREYRIRKRVGKLFCGGIVNYSFIDNWLSGSLYFFPFKAKNKRKNTVKYCKDLVRWIPDQERFYYRSTVFDPSNNFWGFGLSTSANTSNTKIYINRPTTFVDLGPRDEFIKEICTDPSLDVNCSVSRQIGPTSFQNFGELMGLFINYRLDTFNWPNDRTFNLNNFFKNNGFGLGGGFNRVLNGDIMQLISINSEVGIEEFDLQNPKYLGYSYQVLDPECYPQVFKLNTNVWGPLPVTFDLDEDGARQRLCLNQPAHIGYDGKFVNGRLTEAAQDVPFYLWDKKGTGFGPYNENTRDDQSWDYRTIQVQPLQGMTYAYNITGVPNIAADKYLLLPMTYTFSGLTIQVGNASNDLPYDVISLVDDHTNYDNQYPGFTYLFVSNGPIDNPLNGVLYIRYGAAGQWQTIPWDPTVDFIIKQTEDYYSPSTKQILSTPFLFYFGLRPGKTGLDKFIEKFGPSGAFQNVD